MSGELETRRRIIELVYNGKLVLDSENRTNLTEDVNPIFTICAEFTRVSECVNEKRQPKNGLPNVLVAGDGFEPTTFGL